MTMLRWHLDAIGEYGLRLEYDPTRDLWLASAEVEDGDEEDDDERVAFELTELLAAITDETADSPWIVALPAAFMSSAASAAPPNIDAVTKKAVNTTILCFMDRFLL